MAQRNSQTIATVYAQALFDLAQDRSQINEVYQELEQLSAVINQQREFFIFLETPAISHREKTASLTRIFAGQLRELTLDFLQVLAVKDRLALLPEIKLAYQKLLDKKAGIVKGKLITAVTLGRKELARLTEQISRALRKTIEFENVVVPALIGGMVIKIDDSIIDSSVRASLLRFSRQIREKADQLIRSNRTLNRDATDEPEV